MNNQNNEQQFDAKELLKSLSATQLLQLEQAKKEQEKELQEKRESAIAQLHKELREFGNNFIAKLTEFGFTGFFLETIANEDGTPTTSLKLYSSGRKQQRSIVEIKYVHNGKEEVESRHMEVLKRVTGEHWDSERIRREIGGTPKPSKTNRIGKLLQANGVTSYVVTYSDHAIEKLI